MTKTLALLSYLRNAETWRVLPRDELDATVETPAGSWQASLDLLHADRAVVVLQHSEEKPFSSAARRGSSAVARSTCTLLVAPA